jgi:hypothetical protein
MSRGVLRKHFGNYDCIYRLIKNSVYSHVFNGEEDRFEGVVRRCIETLKPVAVIPMGFYKKQFNEYWPYYWESEVLSVDLVRWWVIYDKLRDDRIEEIKRFRKELKCLKKIEASRKALRRYLLNPNQERLSSLERELEGLTI